MVRSRAWCALAGVAVVAGALSWAIADDQVPIDKAPPGVQATVHRVVGNNKFVSMDKDVDNGKTVYEVDVEGKKTSYSVHMTDSGAVTGISLDIPMEIVPEAVTAAALQAHPGVKLVEPEIRSENGTLAYKLEMKVGKKKYEMIIAADGKVVSQEAEDEDGGDDKNK